jgi:hypothetical protein
MPGASSNTPYYNNSDLPEDMRKIMQEYEYQKKINMPDEIIVPKRQIEEDIAKKTMDEYERQIKKLMGSSTTNITETERLRREIKGELEEIKEGMRKMGVLFDSDLPDEAAFKKYKMLREAYKKYKMVERLVLGQDDE